MTFVPLRLMFDRAERYGEDSDSILFNELLYVGEFILKLTTAAFVASIEDDREKHRYRLAHGLVRADGIGGWVSALQEALNGAASQQLVASVPDERKAFTQRFSKGTWQHQVVYELHKVLEGVHPDQDKLPDKVALNTWFLLFSQLRNKTRGHGACTPATCANLASVLHSSITTISAKNPMFQLPWAYLHRNLSGRYRVVDLGGDSSKFAKLKSSAGASGENFPNGIYLWAARYRRVELVHTDLNVSDFFFPNGAFRNDTFELHSLITDSRRKGDAEPYREAAGEKPPSETEGRPYLDAVGNVFTNLPASMIGYVSRPHLEAEVNNALLNYRHPIVTLVGRGGVGKTSAVLSVLSEVAKGQRYNVIIWFSARDIDLTVSGAKLVKPSVLTDREIAEEYLSLTGGAPNWRKDKVRATDVMAADLRESDLGPTLFVFDNFETVSSPVDLFQWIDTNIRLPNKAVITSRFRDFKADYPIEVSGMEREEAEALVAQTAKKLGIENLIGKDECSRIIEEANGHPYVIKIILGEMADAGKFSTPSRLIARQDDILNALFERTFANLTPMATRIFMTLCGWRSLVPQLAVEAVILRNENIKADPEAAIDQLVRMSLVDRKQAEDSTDFLEVPLAAALFGKKKLEVSPSRTLIANDIRFLQDIGAITASGLKGGIGPRVEAFFKKAAQKLSDGDLSQDEIRPVLEFLASGYPPAWLLLSELEEEIDDQSCIDRATKCVRQYLETQPSDLDAGAAWQRLYALYRANGDVIGGCGAFLKAAEINTPSLYKISAMANWLNTAPETKDGVEMIDRRELFRPLAELMETHIDEAAATDLSRLAWLHLHSGEADEALRIAQLGLNREPDNIHCHRLAEKLAKQDAQSDPLFEPC